MCQKSFSAVRQKYPGGCSAPMESSSLPFLLSRIGLAITVCQFCPSQTQCTATALAVHCNRSCSALHPSLQCTASSTLIHATFPASTCIRPCKYVRPRKISEWMEPSVEMRGSEKLPERGLVWIKRKVYKVYRGKDALRRNTGCTGCLFHIRFLDFSE